MTTLTSADAPDVIYFNCPECKGQCRMSGKQHAVQHAQPTCRTWHAHAGNMQEFLRLAMTATKGNLILGAVGCAAEPSAPSDEKAKNALLEQIYEGLKKL